MILVYQMAKVGSQSWVEAAKPAPAARDSAPLHCHFVMPTNRERLETVFRWPAARQTVANMMFPRDLVRSGAAAWERIEAARHDRQAVRVLSGMRDPVARSVSILLFMRDFYGHVSRPLNPRVGVDAGYMIECLQENWKFVLERREPDQSFEWLLWYLTGVYRSWFAEELGAAFGIDVLDGSFQRQEGAQRIRTAGADIFVYRFEDMTPEAPGHARLLEQASAFLEVPLSELPNVNTSSTRRSRELSSEVRRRFRLPADMLDAIYGEPIVRHFYSDGEIEAFKKRWMISSA
jgi:hypothetical protein